MELKGSKTEKNLWEAFAGESQARNKYTYFASKAKKEGYEQIAGIFLETADNEKEHAKRFFKFLEGGMAQFTASFPAGIIGTARFTGGGIEFARASRVDTVIRGMCNAQQNPLAVPMPTRSPVKEPGPSATVMTFKSLTTMEERLSRSATTRRRARPRERWV